MGVCLPLRFYDILFSISIFHGEIKRMGAASRRNKGGIPDIYVGHTVHQNILFNYIFSAIEIVKKEIAFYEMPMFC